MPDSKSVVVDTNILISALLRDRSRFSQIILSSNHTFYVCESVIVELFKHKSKIVQNSKLTETEITRLLYIILRRLTIVKEDLIDQTTRKEAYQLCSDIDPADSPYIALTKHLDGLLWTGDKKLKQGLEKKGFTSFYEPE